MSANKPLMPKATAVWLIENTGLTFDQIAEFCQIHSLEVKHLADQEYPPVGFDPVANGQLTAEEISRCEDDASQQLQGTNKVWTSKKQRTRYTPLAKRANKPNAIAWIVKKYPSLPDAAIKTLLGTTSLTIQSIRQRTHPGINEIKAQSPVELGFCTQEELETFLVRYDLNNESRTSAS